MSCFFKKLDNRQSPKKKTVLFNFSCALFLPLDFLMFEDGTNRLSQNSGMELPLYAAYYHTRVQISHDNLAMHGS